MTTDPGIGGRRRQLGVVLTPAEVQDEGLDRVLDGIAHPQTERSSQLRSHGRTPAMRVQW